MKWILIAIRLALKKNIEHFDTINFMAVIAQTSVAVLFAETLININVKSNCYIKLFQEKELIVT